MIYDDRTGFSLISSVSQAADFLFAYHKEYGSPAWSDAMNCCSDIKLGTSTPEQVSAAFIAAVTGAGIRIDPTLRLY
ncbi:DUF982 domain-containing protein [Aquamicrobium terrae]